MPCNNIASFHHDDYLSIHSFIHLFVFSCYESLFCFYFYYFYYYIVVITIYKNDAIFIFIWNNTLSWLLGSLAQPGVAVIISPKDDSWCSLLVSWSAWGLISMVDDDTKDDVAG